MSSRYTLLVAPSSNRVYGLAAPRLAAAELAAFGSVLSTPLSDVEELRLGGVAYVGFSGSLTQRDIAYLSNVSSAYAFFEQVGDLLRPVELSPLAKFDDDLVTIPKYAGKTNEQFTKLLLNVTLLASARAGEMLERRLTVLDPLCGRGTTLNQALMYGYDAIGIESDAKDVEAYSAFLRTWLKRKRLKHKAETHPVRRERRIVARQLEVDIGGEQRVSVFAADTTDARQLMRAGCCDVIVADAPYGVAHGSRTAGALSRRPLELLAAALPGWVELLRSGGALGISWNTHVASRQAAAEVLDKAGLQVVDAPAYGGFEHWVDQAITRDILVARKP
ncbi:MAG TPA: SAM-dependent methyltransferase [Micromonosporaceae bacterium]|nr:SAM-dependent methyltransferase [Micromonosporaceae bacterium]